MLQFRYAQMAPDDFARCHFAQARLRDPRRVERAIQIATAMARQPGASIPAMLDDPYSIKAAYAFLDRPEATPDHLQAGHRQLVHEQLRTAGHTFLLVEDTSDLSWSGNAPVVGLGPIAEGTAGLQGFRLHSVLAAPWPQPDPAPTDARRPPLQLLGLLDQQYWVRTPRPAGERPGIDTHKRQERQRESQMWMHATERLGAAPAGVRWVRVCDREADIYQFLRGLQANGHGYVIRAMHNRTLIDTAREGQPLKLLDYARSLEPFDATMQLTLRSRPQRAASTTQLKLAAAPVLIRAPQQPGHGPGFGEPIQAYVVRVYEPHPPTGSNRLEWILLTERPVTDFAAARQTALQYSARWLIEEFHKALKTGLKAERLQLETAERLFAAIAIMSIVALRLIDLREAVRINPQAPAEQSGLDADELHVLRARLGRKIETVRDAALAVGRLGGHMNRRGDGMPGWLTLWRGMIQLHWLVQGFLLAQSGDRSGE